MRRLLLACGLMALSSAAFATDDINVSVLAQADFNDLSQDLGAVTSYKQLQGSASEGIAGFDFSFNAGATQVSHQQAWKHATDDDISTVPFADVRVSKGLPFGIDIGGLYSFVPGSNIH